LYGPLGDHAAHRSLVNKVLAKSISFAFDGLIAKRTLNYFAVGSSLTEFSTALQERFAIFKANATLMYSITVHNLNIRHDTDTIVRNNVAKLAMLLDDHPNVRLVVTQCHCPALTPRRGCICTNFKPGVVEAFDVIYYISPKTFLKLLTIRSIDPTLSIISVNLYGEGDGTAQIDLSQYERAPVADSVLFVKHVCNQAMGSFANDVFSYVSDPKVIKEWMATSFPNTIGYSLHKLYGAKSFYTFSIIRNTGYTISHFHIPGRLLTVYYVDGLEHGVDFQVESRTIYVPNIEYEKFSKLSPVGTEIVDPIASIRRKVPSIRSNIPAKYHISILLSVYMTDVTLMNFFATHWIYPDRLTSKSTYSAFMADIGKIMLYNSQSSVRMPINLTAIRKALVRFGNAALNVAFAILVLTLSMHISQVAFAVSVTSFVKAVSLIANMVKVEQGSLDFETIQMIIANPAAYQISREFYGTQETGFLSSSKLHKLGHLILNVSPDNVHGTCCGDTCLVPNAPVDSCSCGLTFCSFCKLLHTCTTSIPVPRDHNLDKQSLSILPGAVRFLVADWLRYEEPHMCQKNLRIGSGNFIIPVGSDQAHFLGGVITPASKVFKVSTDNVVEVYRYKCSLGTCSASLGIGPFDWIPANLPPDTQRDLKHGCDSQCVPKAMLSHCCAKPCLSCYLLNAKELGQHAKMGASVYNLNVPGPAPETNCPHTSNHRYHLCASYFDQPTNYMIGTPLRHGIIEGLDGHDAVYFVYGMWFKSKFSACEACFAKYGPFSFVKKPSVKPFRGWLDYYRGLTNALPDDIYFTTYNLDVHKFDRRTALVREDSQVECGYVPPTFEDTTTLLRTSETRVLFERKSELKKSLKILQKYLDFDEHVDGVDQPSLPEFIQPYPDVNDIRQGFYQSPVAATPVPEHMLARATMTTNKYAIYDGLELPVWVFEGKLSLGRFVNPEFINSLCDDLTKTDNELQQLTTKSQVLQKQVESAEANLRQLEVTNKSRQDVADKLDNYLKACKSLNLDIDPVELAELQGKVGQAVKLDKDIVAMLEQTEYLEKLIAKNETKVKEINAEAATERDRLAKLKQEYESNMNKLQKDMEVRNDQLLQQLNQRLDHVRQDIDKAESLAKQKLDDELLKLKDDHEASIKAQQVELNKQLEQLAQNKTTLETEHEKQLSELRLKQLAEIAAVNDSNNQVLQQEKQKLELALEQHRVEAKLIEDRVQIEAKLTIEAGTKLLQNKKLIDDVSELAQRNCFTCILDLDQVPAEWSNLSRTCSLGDLAIALSNPTANVHTLVRQMANAIKSGDGYTMATILYDAYYKDNSRISYGPMTTWSHEELDYTGSGMMSFNVTTDVGELKRAMESVLDGHCCLVCKEFISDTPCQCSRGYVLTANLKSFIAKRGVPSKTDFLMKPVVSGGSRGKKDELDTVDLAFVSFLEVLSMYRLCIVLEILSGLNVLHVTVPGYLFDGNGGSGKTTLFEKPHGVGANRKYFDIVTKLKGTGSGVSITFQSYFREPRKNTLVFDEVGLWTKQQILNTLLASSNNDMPMFIADRMQCKSPGAKSELWPGTQAITELPTATSHCTFKSDIFPFWRCRDGPFIRVVLDYMYNNNTLWNARFPGKRVQACGKGEDYMVDVYNGEQVAPGAVVVAYAKRPPYIQSVYSTQGKTINQPIQFWDDLDLNTNDDFIKGCNCVLLTRGPRVVLNPYSYAQMFGAVVTPLSWPRNHIMAAIYPDIPNHRPHAYNTNSSKIHSLKTLIGSVKEAFKIANKRFTRATLVSDMPKPLMDVCNKNGFTLSKSSLAQPRKDYSRFTIPAINSGVAWFDPPDTILVPHLVNIVKNFMLQNPTSYLIYRSPTCSAMPGVQLASSAYCHSKDWCDRREAWFMVGPEFQETSQPILTSTFGYLPMPDTDAVAALIPEGTLQGDVNYDIYLVNETLLPNSTEVRYYAVPAGHAPVNRNDILSAFFHPHSLGLASEEDMICMASRWTSWVTTIVYEITNSKGRLYRAGELVGEAPCASTIPVFKDTPLQVVIPITHPMRPRQLLKTEKAIRSNLFVRPDCRDILQAGLPPYRFNVLPDKTKCERIHKVAPSIIQPFLGKIPGDSSIDLLNASFKLADTPLDHSRLPDLNYLFNFVGWVKSNIRNWISAGLLPEPELFDTDGQVMWDWTLTKNKTRKMTYQTFMERMHDRWERRIYTGFVKDEFMFKNKPRFICVADEAQQLLLGPACKRMLDRWTKLMRDNPDCAAYMTSGLNGEELAALMARRPCTRDMDFKMFEKSIHPVLKALKIRIILTIQMDTHHLFEKTWWSTLTCTVQVKKGRRTMFTFRLQGKTFSGAPDTLLGNNVLSFIIVFGLLVYLGLQFSNLRYVGDDSGINTIEDLDIFQRAVEALGCEIEYDIIEDEDQTYNSKRLLCDTNGTYFLAPCNFQKIVKCLCIPKRDQFSETLSQNELDVYRALLAESHRVGDPITKFLVEQLQALYGVPQGRLKSKLRKRVSEDYRVHNKEGHVADQRSSNRYCLSVLGTSFEHFKQAFKQGKLDMIIYGADLDGSYTTTPGLGLNDDVDWDAYYDNVSCDISSLIKLHDQ